MNIRIPTQSAIIELVANRLGTAGWTVAYTCRPNRAHVGVVPIPTSSHFGQQRYPDVVSTDGVHVRLTEVEPTFSPDVQAEIASRFWDHCAALGDPEKYERWSTAVLRQTRVRLPPEFRPLCELVVIRPPVDGPPPVDISEPGVRFTVVLADSYQPS